MQIIKESERLFVGRHRGLLPGDILRGGTVQGRSVRIYPSQRFISTEYLEHDGLCSRCNWVSFTQFVCCIMQFGLIPIQLFISLRQAYRYFIQFI